MFILLQLGCIGTCGSYTIQTGVWFDQVMGDLWEGDPTATQPEGHDFVALDGEYREQCGKKWGTWGNWDLLGDGRATINFQTYHPDFDLDINSIPIDLYATVPVGDWQPGQRFELGSTLLGWAELTDMSGEHFKQASLVSGWVEVTSGTLDGDVCAEDEGWAQGVGPTFGLSWELEWSDGADVHYAAEGADDVWFDTFLSAACDTTYASR